MEKNFRSHTVTLTLIRQCPMLNLSELFPYATTDLSFKLIHPSLSYHVHTRTRTHPTHTNTHTYAHTHTCTHTYRHTQLYDYSIVAVDKPQTSTQHMREIAELVREYDTND